MSVIGIVIRPSYHTLQPARSEIYYCIKWSRWVLMMERFREIPRPHPHPHPHHHLWVVGRGDTNFIRKLSMDKYRLSRRRGPEKSIGTFYHATVVSHIYYYLHCDCVITAFVICND